MEKKIKGMIYLIREGVFKRKTLYQPDDRAKAPLLDLLNNQLHVKGSKRDRLISKYCDMGKSFGRSNADDTYLFQLCWLYSSTPSN